MTTIFFYCALVGGVFLVGQFVLTLIGLGGDALDFDVEMPDDLDTDFDTGDTHYDSNWFFGIVSFRTVIAALTFFGICGMIAHSYGASAPLQIVIALAGGFSAMYGVATMMDALRRLSQDGTQRIEGTIGSIGTVYVPIPPNQSGVGKVHVELQDRMVEYAAMTESSEKIPTTGRVEILEVIDESTLLVRPVQEKQHKGDALEESSTV